MFDSQCDLAALVYEQHQDPDRILRDFAIELNERGYRAVGLVQLGHHCTDGNLSAMLVHSGEPDLAPFDGYRGQDLVDAASMLASCSMPASRSRAPSTKAPTC